MSMRINFYKRLKSIQGYPNYSLHISKSMDAEKGMLYRTARVTQRLLIFLQICSMSKRS